MKKVPKDYKIYSKPFKWFNYKVMKKCVKAGMVQYFY